LVKRKEIKERPLVKKISEKVMNDWALRNGLKHKLVHGGSP
jgi:hypothetical protein